MEDHYLESGGVYRGGLLPQVGGGGPIGEDYHLRSGGEGVLTVEDHHLRSGGRGVLTVEDHHLVLR